MDLKPDMTPPLILASQSTSRAALLRQAGLAFETYPAHVDEETAKRSLQAEKADPNEAALFLAEMKAVKVSAKFPDALVVGADQILTCNQVWFDKAPDLTHAQAHLTALRGKAHILHTGVCVAKAGARIWGENHHATLTMRAFSDAFLDTYLSESGETILSAVGCYQLEGLGAQLFQKIEGDYFTILGLPLLPLLNFLRQHEALPG